MPAGTRPRAGRGPIRFELARSGSAGPQPGQRSTELCPGRPQPGQRSTELCPERPRPGPPGTPNFTPIHRPASGGHITLQSGARDGARPTRIGPVRTGSDGRSDGRTGRSARDDPVPGLLGSRILHLSTGPHRGHRLVLFPFFAFYGQTAWVDRGRVANPCEYVIAGVAVDHLVYRLRKWCRHRGH